MPRYISRLYIVVEAESQAEACDAMSACLSENLKYDGHIVEWGYTRTGAGYTAPRQLPADAPADLDPEDVTLAPNLDDLFARRLPAEHPELEAGLQSYKVSVSMAATLSLVVHSHDSDEAEEGAAEALWNVLDAAGVGYNVEWMETNSAAPVAAAAEV